MIRWVNLVPMMAHPGGPPTQIPVIGVSMVFIAVLLVFGLLREADLSRKLLEISFFTLCGVLVWVSIFYPSISELYLLVIFGLVVSVILLYTKLA